MSRVRRAADRIREEIPLLSVLRDYGYHVHEDGGMHEQQFSCDLHGDGSDNKPSARLYPEDNQFFCFACGRPRDSIALVQEKEGLKFWDAVKLLESKYGLSPLPWDPSDAEKPPEEKLGQELQQVLDPTETPEQALERLARFLMGLCQDRELTPQRLAGFWEAHDRVTAFMADNGDPKQVCLMAHQILEKAKLALRETR
jgi:DNA primase